MSSNNKNSFLCGSTYTDLRPAKWLSPPCRKNDYALLLKEKLRSECLEKARQRRLERANRVRSTASMPIRWNTPSPEGGNTTLRNTTSTMAANDCSNEYTVEAQRLIQETMWSVEKSCCSTPSPAFHTEPSSFTVNSALTTPVRFDRGENSKSKYSIYGTDNIFSTPNFGYSWSNNGCYLSESELLCLMQEVQEELQREGV
jgi:hypothetical protein